MNGMRRIVNDNLKRTRHHSIEMSSKLLNSMEEGEVNKKKTLTIWGLLRLLRPYFWPESGSDGAFINRCRSSATWAFVLLSKVSSLIAPFYLISATNYLTQAPLELRKSIISLSIFCSLKLATVILKELQSLIYIKVKQQANIELQEYTFKHLHTLSLNWHLTKKTGSVVKAMDRGVEATDTLVTYMFLFLVPALFECLAVVIIFFWQYRQWSIGLTVFIGVVMYILLTILITRWRRNLREKSNKHDNDYHDKVNDSILNFETIKYFSAEAYELQRFHTSILQYQEFSSSTKLASNLLNIAQQFVLYVTLFICLVFSSYAVVQQKMSIGEWIAVQSWVTTIFVPLNFLGGVYNAIVQSMIDLRNLSELLSEEPDIVDSPGATPLPIYSNKPSTTPVDSKKNNKVSISFKNVNFHYPTQHKHHGLQNINIHIEGGTTTAIVGSTGSGKTTLSRLLFRFYDPISGEILINGFDIKKHTQASVRGMIGVVPQDTVLFNESIMYNIQYGNITANQQQIEAAADAAQIKSFILTLPEKWDTVVGERGLKLSGGEKQRVAIARCLLKDPPIVLLDEATSALDTVTENSIQQALYTLGNFILIVLNSF